MKKSISRQAVLAFFCLAGCQSKQVPATAFKTDNKPYEVRSFTKLGESKKHLLFHGDTLMATSDTLLIKRVVQPL